MLAFRILELNGCNLTELVDIGSVSNGIDKKSGNFAS